MHVADSHDLILVAGARENSLKNISVEIRKRRLTVFTRVSGSGKSPPAVSIWPMSTTFSVFSTGWSSQGSTLTGQHLAGYVGAK